MANPQPDTFTKISNELLDAIYHTNFSPHEGRVFWFIVRKTYGFQKKTDWISESQFAKGIGLDRRIIHRNLKQLRARNIITAIHADGKKRISYGIQKDYEKWKVVSTRMAERKTAIHTDGTLSSTPHTAIHTEDTLPSTRMTKVPSTRMTKVPSTRMHTIETPTKETLQKKAPPPSPPQGGSAPLVLEGGLSSLPENAAKTDPGDGRLEQPNKRRGVEVWMRALGNGLHDWFVKDFWPIQIRPVERKACAIAIYKLNPDADLRAKMVKALKYQIATDFNYRIKSRVPYPASWVKKRRWEDEVKSKEPKWVQELREHERQEEQKRLEEEKRLEAEGETEDEEVGDEEFRDEDERPGECF
jgi:phage replication O-like protein O